MDEYLDVLLRAWRGESFEWRGRRVAITPLRPSGQAEIEGEICDVVSDMGYVEPGQRVRVLRANRFSLMVEPVEGDASGEDIA